MKLRRVTSAILTICTIYLATSPAASARPLPVDGRIVKGKCANGVKWLYREHDNPPGKMALMFHVRSGSLNETEEQRGLAHFLEHMCFNGSENFAPGELIPYFESIGMEFGADLNAFTSFDQTVYMLFTPDTETEQLDKALMVLSDYAFRTLLLDEEIDKERGVVLEESRRGKSAFQRVRDKLWPELFEGSRFAQRLPIGDDDIIANAPREEFVDYYRTWYRPENITVVLVGDAKAERVTPLIEKWFGKYEPDVPARKQMGAEFKSFTKQRGIVVTDPELAMCQVQMLNIRPGRPPVVTYEQARVDLVEYIGSWIVGRRYDERVNKGEASYRGAGASVMNFFNDGLLIYGSASGEPEDWNKMLEELVVEINRAREHGFTQREFELAKKEILADAKRAVETEPTRNARRMTRQYISAVNDRIPISSAKQDLGVYENLLPKISLEDVTAAFKKHFKPGTFAYVITTPDTAGSVIPSRDEVLAAARAAWEIKTDAPDFDEAPTDLLAEMPKPGKVVEKRIHKELEITSLWLENGIRVHHRFMDYKKDSVMMSISLAGGAIEESASNVGITQVASLAVNEAATNRLTSTNMRDIMTGTNINVRGSGRGDSFTFNINGSPKDLDIGLQKAHALLTDGLVEESAFKNWKLQMLQQIDMMQRMPQFKAQEALYELLSGGDPRRPFLNKKDVEALTLGDAQRWYNRLCKEAPIEVAIVGEISLDDVMPIVRKYIGSLPKRKRSAEHLDSLRKFARPTGPLAQRIDVDTVTPQAMAIAGFVGCEGRNTDDRRALSIAANVLTSRLVKKIREELSIVYSIRCRNNPAWVYRDAGRFSAGASCDPANSDKVIEQVHSMFKEFAESGPTEEEMENAKKQIANNLDTSMREPSYWFNILQHHDLHGRNLSEQVDVKDAYKAYTAARVQDVFRKYYTPARQFRVSAIPTGASTAANEKPDKKPAS